MGIEKVGIGIIHDIVKTKGGSVLRSTPSVFHGINPTLRYAEGGKSFALPRFCSKEMQEARKMNQIAIRQAKAGEVVRTYSKATPEDLRRLTSETIEDSYSRVEWTNPKDGKLYNLLKQGETEDGKVIVRILDEEGAFIKEAKLVPKKVCIIDSFEVGADGKIPHGILVHTYAKKSNPFAIFENKNIGKLDRKEKYDVPSFVQALKSVGDCDYLNLSFGSEFISENMFHSKIYKMFVDYTETAFRCRDFSKKIFEAKNKISSNGTRIMQASGNKGKYHKNYELINQTEGVGAISTDGKIADYSASRNSKYTQHYERGTFTPNEVYLDGELVGYNITDTKGVDISIDEILELYKSNSDLKNLFNNLSDLSAQENRFREILDSLSDKQDKKELKEVVDKIVGICNKKWEIIHTISKKIGLNSSTLRGTSISTPIRTAKLALNDMMEGIL